MNLYFYHDLPEDLHRHEERDFVIPSKLWTRFKDEPEVLRKHENVLARDAHYAFRYAKEILHGPFPKGEDTISKQMTPAFRYAADILKGAFPKGEDIISTEGWAAAQYAIDITKKPFLKGEPVIAMSGFNAEAYVKRFPERKEAIVKLIHARGAK